MKSSSNIRKAIKELRHAVENSPDKIEQRVAYEVENALRWATLDTVGWKRPAESAKETAKMIRADCNPRTKGI